MTGLHAPVDVHVGFIVPAVSKYVWKQNGRLRWPPARRPCVDTCPSHPPLRCGHRHSWTTRAFIIPAPSSAYRVRPVETFAPHPLAPFTHVNELFCPLIFSVYLQHNIINYIYPFANHHSPLPEPIIIGVLRIGHSTHPGFVFIT